jgi:hypothetical protein
MKRNSQLHAPAVLLPTKVPQFPLRGRLSEHHSRSGPYEEEKNRLHLHQLKFIENINRLTTFSRKVINEKSEKINKYEGKRSSV